MAAKSRLSLVVPIALALIFILLFFTFQSFLEASIIYLAIPLSAIGGIWALWIRDMPFSVSAGIGFIALFGVAVLTGIASGAVLKLNLEEAAKEAKKTNEEIAKIIGINKAARVTTVKPSGTSSLVLGTSSGIHAWHNDYYVRRMRLGKNESLYKYLIKNHPELLEDDFFKPTIQAIISVPQKSPEGAIYRTESALDLLERTKKLNVEWVKAGHRKGANTNNVSATVSVKPEEWDQVGEWMWNNKDTFNGLSVLPYFGGTYTQAPFEDITEEQFNEMVQHLHNIDLSKIVEFTDDTALMDQAACAGGACEIV